MQVTFEEGFQSHPRCPQYQRSLTSGTGRKSVHGVGPAHGSMTAPRRRPSGARKAPSALVARRWWISPEEPQTHRELIWGAERSSNRERASLDGSSRPHEQRATRVISVVVMLTIMTRGCDRNVWAEHAPVGERVSCLAAVLLALHPQRVLAQRRALQQPLELTSLAALLQTLLPLVATHRRHRGS